MKGFNGKGLNQVQEFAIICKEGELSLFLGSTAVVRGIQRNLIRKSVEILSRQVYTHKTDLIPKGLYVVK